MAKKPEPHWLTRPETIRILWIVSAVILAAIVGLQFLVPIKGHFGIDGTYGFFAWFGFLTCVVMVVFAKALGYLIKRPDDYYDQR